MSSARWEHFLCGIVLGVVYLWLKKRRGDRLLLHPVTLAAAVPMLYLGTALPDWDITVFGIGGHRNPLFHSAIPYFGLAWLWHKLGLSEVVSTIGGPRLAIALHVGLALGLPSRLSLVIRPYCQLRWISGVLPARLW